MPLPIDNLLTRGLFSPLWGLARSRAGGSIRSAPAELAGVDRIGEELALGER